MGDFAHGNVGSNERVTALKIVMQASIRPRVTTVSRSVGLSSTDTV